uniref:Arf-GAP domain-containing protein n=1 Tax=Syphacia muris TaxID=451379 RepID=A0A0N5ADC4_9BILA
HYVFRIKDFTWSGRLFHCADCNTDNPEWASLNRGVLICSECCYVHRNLGRHISHVRSLQKGNWNKNQLELMYVLYSNGSNSIWEHTLLDPLTSSKVKRKPKPHDPVLPVKESFIKEKYAHSAFTLRPSKDEGPINQNDLDRQLWSCVRTSHVITTLRLLSLGADPNYADAEKKNSALHIAAKEGQELQVELLCIYGADAGQPNASDLLPSEIARLENNHELATRLEDLRFEVTDRLSMFLCGRKPDHSRKQDFLIPELIAERPLAHEVSSLRRRLSVIPSHCFERIVQDVYDEVDRRETMASWNAVMQGIKPINLGNEEWVAVFLPPNPEMTATRNQLRQKLAKCGSKEFATLVIDILKEAKRRYKSGGTSGEAAQVLRSVSMSDYAHLKERVKEAEQKLAIAERTNENLQL